MNCIECKSTGQAKFLKQLILADPLCKTTNVYQRGNQIQLESGNLPECLALCKKIREFFNNLVTVKE